jgi:ligand-binding sensor protein
MEQTLQQLIDIKKWQKIQDAFSSITHISMRTLDAKGTAITTPSNEPRLCSELLRKPRNNYEDCQTCLPTFLGGHSVIDRNLSYLCPPGLHNFIAPLNTDENKALGYVVMGPVILVARKPKEYYCKIAEELNIDSEEFWSAIMEIRVLSFYRIQAIVEMVRNIGAYILQIASRSIIMEEEIQKLAMGVSTRLNELLDKFLDVALYVSGADIGSIMMLDERKKELTIHASRGLPNEVVKKARVRFGEGISGIAAKDDACFLIDDTSQDNRIKPFLSRPQIKSSMVLPIKIENKVVGVMNLGALVLSTVRFNTDNIRSMNELIDLAALTLRIPKKGDGSS